MRVDHVDVVLANNLDGFEHHLQIVERTARGGTHDHGCFLRQRADAVQVQPVKRNVLSHVIGHHVHVVTSLGDRFGQLAD